MPTKIAAACVLCGAGMLLGGCSQRNVVRLSGLRHERLARGSFDGREMEFSEVAGAKVGCGQEGNWIVWEGVYRHTSCGGAKKETAKSIGSLKIGFPVALLLIYSLIAVLFRSYFQPIIVMAAIPYALVGAIFGHLIMGYPFTLLSMIGSVALAGIVVNDSLILVDFINRRRREGMPVIEAVIAGGRARLRAILLTSITTIFGILPLGFSAFTVRGAPMGSLSTVIAGGLATSTVFTLIGLPVWYTMIEDIGSMVARLVPRWKAARTKPEATGLISD